MQFNGQQFSGLSDKLFFNPQFFLLKMQKYVVFEEKNLFWSIKNSGEILDKLKARDFNATSLSTYDFSTLYTTLPHNLIKDKLIDLIERTFQREGSPYLACSDRNAFFTSEKPKKYHAWHQAL